MKKIIILISLCSIITTVAADNNSVGGGYGLLSGSDYELGSSYTVGAGLESNSVDYNLFPSTDSNFSTDTAWVGIGSKYGELRFGSHESLDSFAIADADQQQEDGAYDLLLQSENSLSQSLTYIGKSGAISAGAQLSTDDTDEKKSSTGLLLNAQSRSVEAAIGYRQISGEEKSVKGRLTYKSRNNSRVRVDLIAEKVAVDDALSSGSMDSTAFMLGAKYSVTPKAYVVGQYGVVGFGDDVDLSSDSLTENKDFNALSLEAGYSLSDKTSVYINHTQKSYDSGLQLPFSDSLEGSQTNSIGVRLNW